MYVLGKWYVFECDQLPNWHTHTHTMSEENEKARVRKDNGKKHKQLKLYLQSAQTAHIH